MIDKDLSPAGRSLRVTFELPAEVADESVSVVGDFNEWTAGEDRMELMPRNGIWRTKVSLEPGRRYEFRYLIDGEVWRNDEQADDYTPNPYFEENGVIEG